MKISDTISVNPSKTTLGHVETSSTIFRTRVIDNHSTSNSFDLFKVMFPGWSAGVLEYKKYAVPLRTVFATILIVSGIVLLESSLSIPLAVCSLCFGVFLALGLFTRPVMLGAATFYCITGALMLRAGEIDMNVFSLMFGCLIFAVIGGGKYSCDTLIIHYIMRHRKNTEQKNKDNYMGYKAFHKVKY